MRTRLAVLVVLAIVVAGCGGSAKKTTFTNTNWGQLEFNAATGKDNGSPVELRPGMSVIPTIETKSQAQVRQAVAASRASNKVSGG